jgi:hypothetical protein
MERSGMRGCLPDFAALHPGYACWQSQYNIVVVEREKGGEIAKHARPTDEG